MNNIVPSSNRPKFARIDLEKFNLANIMARRSCLLIANIRSDNIRKNRDSFGSSCADWGGERGWSRNGSITPISPASLTSLLTYSAPEVLHGSCGWSEDRLGGFSRNLEYDFISHLFDVRAIFKWFQLF